MEDADSQTVIVRPSGMTRFEQVIANNPPILESLIAQLPTESILSLYHTSYFLQKFLQQSPTSWRYISWRLHQPAITTPTPTNNANGTTVRQSSNYALDQLLIYVINPFSTRLTSLELDNTAVSGATLFQTVMVLRKETLEHVSVRGCKNVSLKYHINPWLTMHAMALDRPKGCRPPDYQKLALKSLYTYRCRHHRRRPYLPSSLARKESDSEPTHELVLTCHKLGIWTDTAWCTTPGARCYRRRGYVTMRVPQDPREVWVVYDRLWRSRNWFGLSPALTHDKCRPKTAKRDGRIWEYEEEAVNGEPIGTREEGKETPAHKRSTHTKFVENIYCDNCSDPILERCEQCSVTMHCSGCRKTLCASCAFDRPYLRNQTASVDEKNKFWWAPGCAVSPCSMADADPFPASQASVVNLGQQTTTLPSIRFKWCCTEPVFSGGGGITFGAGSNHDCDKIRAVPLRTGKGYEDPEFTSNAQDVHEPILENELSGHIGAPLSRSEVTAGPGGRWQNIGQLLRADPTLVEGELPSTVPRILCEDCYSSDQWKIKCKACSISLCLKHDVKDRLRVRVCGYKDLLQEQQDFQARSKAWSLLMELWRKRKALKHQQMALKKIATSNVSNNDSSDVDMPLTLPTTINSDSNIVEFPGLISVMPTDGLMHALSTPAAFENFLMTSLQSPLSDSEIPGRPLSPGSNSTGPPSRSSSPAPSTRSLGAISESHNMSTSTIKAELTAPTWKGCQSFFCPATRAPGDHRRRCVAVIRQCTDCKVHVCDDCVGGLEKPCVCKGCRLPLTEIMDSQNSGAFFCPNCRWRRMQNGKCKRRPAPSGEKDDPKKKHKQKQKKPPEPRDSRRRNAMSMSIFDDSDPNFHLSNLFPDLTDEDGSVQSHEITPREIQELQDMGATARDLIRRIQILRHEAGPGSPIALALPDIRFENVNHLNRPATDDNVGPEMLLNAVHSEEEPED